MRKYSLLDIAQVYGQNQGRVMDFLALKRRLLDLDQSKHDPWRDTIISWGRPGNVVRWCKNWLLWKLLFG